MNDPRTTRDATLSAEAALRVNAACDRFEAAWKTGRRPRIGGDLAGVGGPERAALLRELVLLDMDHRRLRGEEPTAEEYAACFPSPNPGWAAGDPEAAAAEERAAEERKRRRVVQALAAVPLA